MGPGSKWAQWALGSNGPWAQTDPGPKGALGSNGPGQMGQGKMGQAKWAEFPCVPTCLAAYPPTHLQSVVVNYYSD